MKLQKNTRNIRDVGATIPSKEGASQRETLDRLSVQEQHLHEVIIGQGSPVSSNDGQNFTMSDSRSQKQSTTRHRTNSRVQAQRGHGVTLEANVVTGQGTSAT